jgi:hypothetical protein
MPEPAPERTPPDTAESRCRNHPDEPCTCEDTEWQRTPPDDTILEEAAEQLMEEHAENGGGKPYYLEIAADVLRVAEKRVRARAQELFEQMFRLNARGQFDPAREVEAAAREARRAADMLAEGLPDE